MTYLIGVDEAGYAPNLGPLVISATLWRVEADGAASPGAAGEENLYKRLRSVVCKSPVKRGNRRVAIADSKALYTPAQGLEGLERGVLAALALVNHCPDDWLDVWQLLDPRALTNLAAVPWHADYNLRLPLSACPEDLTNLTARLRRGLAAAGVELVAVRSRAVFPDEFNRSTVQLGNKAEALSTATLELLGELLDACDGHPVRVVCDKHGGRNQYGRLLQQQFPERLVEVHGESMRESVYRWGPDEARVEVRFCMGGETFLPAALASMVSKYLRELAMRAFNDFWCGRVTDLAPTAGYPRDARRFKAAIQGMQQQLGIADAVMWRDR